MTKVTASVLQRIGEGMVVLRSTNKGRKGVWLCVLVSSLTLYV